MLEHDSCFEWDLEAQSCCTHFAADRQGLHQPHAVRDGGHAQLERMLTLRCRAITQDPTNAGVDGDKHKQKLLRGHDLFCNEYHEPLRIPFSRRWGVSGVRALTI